MTSTFAGPSGEAPSAGASRGPTAVSAAEVTKMYGKGDAAVHALRGVTIGFACGAYTAIMGRRGPGSPP